MEERSLRVVGTDKTFFNKLTHTLTKILIPTQIGINGMRISMKRNALIKAFQAAEEEEDVSKKENADKKYEDAKNQVEHFYDLLDEKTNIMTNNYIFDTLLNDYIFLIKSKYNAKVKSLINIGNDSFFKDVNNCTEIITIISNFFEQSDKTYLEIKLIEYGTYVQLDLFVESNFDKINDATNIDYFDDYAHLRKIFDK